MQTAYANTASAPTGVSNAAPVPEAPPIATRTGRHPVRHTRPALPTHLPAPEPAAVSEEDDSEEEVDEGDDDVQRRKGIHLNLMIQNLVRQNALIGLIIFLYVTLIRQLQCHNNVYHNMNA